MKKYLTISILLLALMQLGAQVDFRKITSSEEMEKVWIDAGAQNKSVFVDIYATWCGPCKWLDANVFSSKEAGDYMNEKFINVKMDGESQFGRQFAMEAGLSAYPSLFIYNSERKLMNMLVGAKPWEELHQSMLSTLEYFPVLEVLQSKFDDNLLDRKEYPRYVKALREMNKLDQGKMAARKYHKNFVEGDERSIADIQVLAFFTEQLTDDWTRLTADIPKLKSSLAEDLELFIDHAVTASIELGVDKGNIDYIVKLQTILPDLVEGSSLSLTELETRSYVYYYHYSEQIDELINYIDSNFQEKRKGDHKWLFEAAVSAVFLDPENMTLVTKGLDWFQKCIDLEETNEYYYHLAICEYFNESYDLAINHLKKSLEFTDDPELIESIKGGIKQIESEMQ